jgi:hypothetical protein
MIAIEYILAGVAADHYQQRRTRCEAWFEERAQSSRWRQSIATSQGVIIPAEHPFEK